MSNKISLHALTMLMEEEESFKSETEKAPSYKTIERRFKKLVEVFNWNVKDENGEIYLDETEAVFVKGILFQSIDMKGFVYRLLFTDDTDLTAPDTLFGISDFMKNMYDYMTDKISDQDRDSYMLALDRNLKYSALSEFHNIHALIDALYGNLNTLLYPNHLMALMDLRKKIEKEFITSTHEIVDQTIQLANILMQSKEITGESIIDYKYDCDHDIAEEYKQRDRDTLFFLDQNPLIKQHIEAKLNIKVEEIFN